MQWPGRRRGGMVGPAGARGPCRRPRAAAARVGGARPPLRPAAAGGRRPGRRGGLPGPRRAARVVRASGEFDGSDLYVPSDVLGGPAPEEKAANALVNLFTFIAVKVGACRAGFLAPGRWGTGATCRSPGWRSARNSPRREELRGGLTETKDRPRATRRRPASVAPAPDGESPGRRWCAGRTD